MHPLGHGAIRCWHRGDRGERGAFLIRLARGRLLLLGALPHRGFFLGRKSLGRLRGLLRRLVVAYSHVGLSFAVFGV